MKLKEIVAAVRAYPDTAADLECARVELEHTRQALTQSERECDQLIFAGGNLQHDLNAMERRADGLSAALRSFCPRLSTVDEMQKFYECIAPYMDADGFARYFTAKKMTGFHSCHAFPYEDARGQFEEADGNELMGYLLADCFDAVEWDIVHGTSYERATLKDVDTNTPEYRTFQKELYEKTLRQMGFGDLLPPEPAKEKERQHALEKRGSDRNGR